MRKKALVGILLICLISLIFSPIVGTVQAQEPKEPLWSYEVDDWVKRVSLSSDGSYVAAIFQKSGTTENKVCLLNKEGTLLWSYEIEDVRSVSISSDGNYLAANSPNNIWLFNKEGTLLWCYRAEDFVVDLSISSNGSYIAAVSLDLKLYLFNKEGTLLWSYENQTGSFYRVSISSDGSNIAALQCAAEEDLVHLFNNEGELLWSYKTDAMFGRDLSISSDGSYIAAMTSDKLWFFNKEGTLLWSYKIVGKWKTISISSDGSYVAAVSWDKVYLFNKEGTLLWSYELGGIVGDGSISSDGRYVATGTSDGVYFFSREGTPITPMPTENHPPTATRIEPASEEVSINAGEEITFKIRAEDEDGDLYMVQWEVNGEYQKTDSLAILNEPNLEASADFTYAFEESSTVKAIVYDEPREEASVTWEVNVGVIEEIEETSFIYIDGEKAAEVKVKIPADRQNIIIEIRPLFFQENEGKGWGIPNRASMLELVSGFKPVLVGELKFGYDEELSVYRPDITYVFYGGEYIWSVTADSDDIGVVKPIIKDLAGLYMPFTETIGYYFPSFFNDKSDVPVSDFFYDNNKYDQYTIAWPDQSVVFLNPEGEKRTLPFVLYPFYVRANVPLKFESSEDHEIHVYVRVLFKRLLWKGDGYQPGIPWAYGSTELEILIPKESEAPKQRLEPEEISLWYKFIDKFIFWR